METSIPTHQKNVGTFIHLSTFCKYLFPFGNFIAPLVIWSAQKRNSAFIDRHGRGAINFQLSMWLYLIILIVISIPFFIYFAIIAGGGSSYFLEYGHFNDPSDFANLSGFLITAIVVGVIAIGFFILEIIAVISAAVKASNGETYTYPMTINFIKQSEVSAVSSDEPLSKENGSSPSEGSDTYDTTISEGAKT